MADKEVTGIYKGRTITIRIPEEVAKNRNTEYVKQAFKDAHAARYPDEAGRVPPDLGGLETGTGRITTPMERQVSEMRPVHAPRPDLTSKDPGKFPTVERPKEKTLGEKFVDYVSHPGEHATNIAKSYINAVSPINLEAARDFTLDPSLRNASRIPRNIGFGESPDVMSPPVIQQGFQNPLPDPDTAIGNTLPFLVGGATRISPRASEAVSLGKKAMANTEISKHSTGGFLGFGTGMGLGAMAGKAFGFSPFIGAGVGGTYGAAIGSKLPAFVKGARASLQTSELPWIDPRISRPIQSLFTPKVNAEFVDPVQPTGLAPEMLNPDINNPASPRMPSPIYGGGQGQGPQLPISRRLGMHDPSIPYRSEGAIVLPTEQIPPDVFTPAGGEAYPQGTAPEYSTARGTIPPPLGLPEPTPAENVFYGGPEGLEPSTRGVPSPIIPAEPAPNVTPYRVPVVPPSRRLEAAKPAERVFEMPEKTPEPGTEKIPEKPTEPEPKRTPVRPPVKRTQTGATPRDVTVKDVDPEALHDFIKRQASGVELGKIQEKFGLTEEQAKQHLESLKTANKIHQKGSKWHAGEKTTVNPPKGKKETTAEDAEWEALNKKDTEGELTDAEEARWMELSEKRAKKSSSETETETETSKKPVVYSNKVAGFKKTFEAMKKQDPSKWSEFQTARFQELQDILYKAGKERTPSEIESRITEIEEAKKTKDASNEQPEINKDEPKPKPENAKGSTPISGKIIAESDPSWQPGKEISRAQIVTIAKSLGVSSGQVARSLQAAGHKVQESIQPRGWGIKPKGKKAPE